MLEGQLGVTNDGETRIAGPGVVAIVPPNTAPSVAALSDGKVIVADYPPRPGF